MIPDTRFILHTYVVLSRTPPVCRCILTRPSSPGRHRARPPRLARHSASTRAHRGRRQRRPALYRPSTTLVGSPARRTHTRAAPARTIRPGTPTPATTTTTTTMSATTTRAATAAPRARAAHRSTTKSVVASRTARRLTLARAVVDSENTAADRADVQARTRPDVRVRPAGVSDAVVDSAKALEALAALGGNRTCSFVSIVSFAHLAYRALRDRGGDRVG